MGIEIREVVSSYVLDVHGHKIQARITKAVDGSEGFLWDISHLYGGFSRTKTPDDAPVNSREEALKQILDYAKGFEPGYSPKPNSNY